MKRVPKLSHPYNNIVSCMIIKKMFHQFATGEIAEFVTFILDEYNFFYNFDIYLYT